MRPPNELVRSDTVIWRIIPADALDGGSLEHLGVHVQADGDDELG
jgi:hypothetical protein